MCRGGGGGCTKLSGCTVGTLLLWVETAAHAEVGSGLACVSGDGDGVGGARGEGDDVPVLVGGSWKCSAGVHSLVSFNPWDSVKCCFLLHAKCWSCLLL